MIPKPSLPLWGTPPANRHTLQINDLNQELRDQVITLGTVLCPGRAGDGSSSTRAHHHFPSATKTGQGWTTCYGWRHNGCQRLLADQNPIHQARRRVDPGANISSRWIQKVTTAMQTADAPQYAALFQSPAAK